MKFVRIVSCICLALLATGSAESYSPKESKAYSQLPSIVASSTSRPLWPVMEAAISTDSVYTRFNCFGDFGWSSPTGLPDYGWEAHSFSTPRGVGMDYLYSASLLIGGVVGTDTIVSWGGPEFLPVGFSLSHRIGAIIPMEGPADACFWTRFTDTLVTPPIIPGVPYSARSNPLHVSVAERAYAWRTGLAANCILYDFVVTNIGSDTIKSCYGGMYADPDAVGAGDINYLGAWDDLVGGFPDHNICYAIDNDGDPWEGSFDVNTCPTRSLAVKLLAAWPVPRDTAFNWMSSYNYEYALCPSRHGDTLYTNDTLWGIPVGDTSLYHLMQTAGWDYSQVYTGAIPPTDTIWQYPDSASRATFGFGGDSRFVYSFGPYELPPDSSVRFILTLFTGGRVHYDPYILDYVQTIPELYESSLHLAELFATAQVADSLAGILWSPEQPPTGLRIECMGGDSVVVEWDPWGSGNTDGYNLYLSEIPQAAYRDPGTPPIWYKPAELPRPVELNAQHRYSFTGLSPYKAYICYVANRFGGQVGASGEPVVIKLPTPVATPQPDRQAIFFDWGESIHIAWTSLDSGAVQSFNIYRFSDSTEAAAAYSSFYSRFETVQTAKDSFEVDGHRYYLHALPVYSSVSGTGREFVDRSPCDGCVYAITAVDTAGFETPYSSGVIAVRMPARTKDILVMTNSVWQMVNGVYTDSITAFYDRILEGYRHDYYMYEDTLSTCSEIVPACIDWRDMARYRMVIVDDGLRDMIVRDWYEDAEHGFTKYLLSGGVLVYCGSFSQFGYPPFTSYMTPRWYDRQAQFVREFFGVDSVYYLGTNYYKNTTSSPYVDSLLGFARAEAVAGLPSVAFDPLRCPFVASIGSAWPASSPPAVSAFVVDSSAAVTHLFRSLMPATSQVEGRPVGVHKQTAELEAYLFGFHLWYMQESDAKALVDWIMERVPTEVADSVPASLPSSVQLSQNYPNPFNAGTELSFRLPEKERATLDIFNILGQRVIRLLDGEQSAGAHRVTWNGTDESGRVAASGIYLYRLQTSSGAMTRKMVLLR